jgi:hypothetical protein
LGSRGEGLTLGARGYTLAALDIMAWFKIEFIDGKVDRVEADAHELHDSEWLFRHGNEVVAHYDSQQVRGVQKLPPGPVRTSGGGSY